MVSKSKAAYIISLQKKKIREKERLFVIEGDKLVKEFLEAKVGIQTLVAKPEFLNSLSQVHIKEIKEVIPASFEELKKLSSLKTPHNAIALVRMPVKSLDFNDLGTGLAVALDCVQDPGNLGTIIRSAAWFGIRNIYCSEDCVDVFNPKVIQSGMGAILHVSVFYTDLMHLLKVAGERKIKVYGALLKGKSVYSYKLDNNGIILLGNESKGISEELMPFVTDSIMIPGKNKEKAGIESLNVSMAASVLFSEFTRNR